MSEIQLMKTLSEFEKLTPVEKARFFTQSGYNTEGLAVVSHATRNLIYRSDKSEYIRREDATREYNTLLEPYLKAANAVIQDATAICTATTCGNSPETLHTLAEAKNSLLSSLGKLKDTIRQITGNPKPGYWLQLPPKWDTWIDQIKRLHECADNLVGRARLSQEGGDPTVTRADFEAFRRQVKEIFPESASFFSQLPRTKSGRPSGRLDPVTLYVGQVCRQRAKDTGKKRWSRHGQWLHGKLTRQAEQSDPEKDVIKALQEYRKTNEYGEYRGEHYWLSKPLGGWVKDCVDAVNRQEKIILSRQLEADSLD